MLYHNFVPPTLLTSPIASQVGLFSYPMRRSRRMLRAYLGVGFAAQNLTF